VTRGGRLKFAGVVLASAVCAFVILRREA